MNTPPRLIYYSDAHHYHAKRLDPPLNAHKMRWPIDELVGTGVDMLAFGLTTARRESSSTSCSSRYTSATARPTAARR